MPDQLNLLNTMLIEESAPAQRSFVKIEKNLSTLGFFTPSKSRGKVEVRERTVTFQREEDGRVIQVVATILPSAKYGLPTTADQDKYFAFQKILTDLRARRGRVENPVGFTSSELLDILGIRDSGTNYQEVYDWLRRMTLTGINSKGVVYLAKRQTWVTDTFHVFDRVVTFGSEMGNGQVADRNYVWLSDWQLENVNNNYVIPVDLETYWKLRGNIAKALVPLMQLWLYASRMRGLFEKRYSDLCTILDIKPQRHRSSIQKQLGPSLNELVEHGYLENWSLEETSDDREYKIVAQHGRKFLADQQLRLGRKNGESEVPAQLPAPPKVEEGREAPPSPLLQQLLDRGVNERQARRLLKDLPRTQPIELQIRWVDHLLAASNARIQNPPGFLISLLKENVQPAGWFIERMNAAQDDTTIEAMSASLAQEIRYSEYCRQAVQRHIEKEMDAAEHQRMLQSALVTVSRQHPNLPEKTRQEIAAGMVTKELEARLPLMSPEEFRTASGPLFA